MTLNLFEVKTCNVSSLHFLYHVGTVCQSFLLAMCMGGKRLFTTIVADGVCRNFRHLVQRVIVSHKNDFCISTTSWKKDPWVTDDEGSEKKNH
jgi:hypothetical protein